MQPQPTSSVVQTDSSYPRHTAFLPQGSAVSASRYGMRFASSLDDLTAIQRLRFDVFNLELGEGLEESFVTGLDRDEFDLNCHHVLVTDLECNEVVGTYRIQTAEMAAAGPGFYTSGEFELGGIPSDFFSASVEAGRACVAKNHRNGRVLNQLWKGLASYLIWNRKRYLFGCCSLSSQDPNEAKQVFDFLVRGRFLHGQWPTRPLADFVCFGADFKVDVNTPIRLPPLFASYLKLGAKITGPPAIDRRFKTIDFLVILDVDELEPSAYRTFFL